MNTMANRLTIVVDGKASVHFDWQSEARTLCGLETMGDPAIGISQSISTTSKVDCPQCIQTVTFCRQIKANEIGGHDDQ